MRSEGELAIEAYLTPQTSHEGSHCQASGSSHIPLHSRIRGSSPSVDCGTDGHRTSHSVAVLRAAGTTIPHS